MHYKMINSCRGTYGFMKQPYLVFPDSTRSMVWIVRGHVHAEYQVEWEGW